ncbi:hypothetical protein HDF24_01995 [Mucilaginibacter sp. X4EP1]|uniref:hypothetical protein n=1 Tax=Mucilaginibacter sp. X4EP1 TaxID=2723092 RepID=UPI002169448A|nr:hypothetical protein [Mucilaginibacter sp. X4EP1]MCS3811786.1 hypothetical protein [Mucilaginibacter sp. X4EP1]
MKKIYLLLVVVIVFVACKSNEHASKKDSIKTTSVVDHSQKLIKKFKPIIQGVWVKKDYIDEIARTKSPLKAFDKAHHITTMIIEPELVKGDSLLIGVGYGNHEGGNLIVKFSPGHSASSILAYNPGGRIDSSFYELKYLIKKETTLILYTFDQNKKLVDSAEYFRVFDNQNGKELGYGTDYTVNKILISGNYILTDSLNRTSQITFTNDGNVSGLNNFKTFYISIDFTTPPNNLDEIIFDLYSKKNKSYAFNINADTVNLYNTSQSADSINLIKGKLVYKLVRLK